MTPDTLKRARHATGLTQVEAAPRLGVSQPYLAMLERGSRRLPERLARKAARLYGLTASVLPPSDPAPDRRRLDPDALVAALAALDYPGFSHRRRRKNSPRNPVEVLVAALAQDSLEARLVEALPWVVLRYPDLDQEWLVREARLQNLQNRLGFVVSLACRLAERTGGDERLESLRALEAQLERSRLAREDTLGRKALAPAERRWLAEHRSAEALHWNLLTDWSADLLRYDT